MTKIYLIPGFGESCRLKRYIKLTKNHEEKGYQVIPKDPDWCEPLSTQVFPVTKDDIIIGFSFGAVIAYLIANKYPCKKVLLASLSPIHKLSFKEMSVNLISCRMPKENAIKMAKDIKSIKIDLKKIKTPYIKLAGQLEIPVMLKAADVIAPNTGHIMNSKYINAISKIL